MNPPNLTLEQQFSVRMFQSQTQGLTQEQALELLLELYTQMILKESIYQNLLKKQWGISDGCNG
jgi:hypothetical protein